jgi:hypothetical protein
VVCVFLGGGQEETKKEGEAKKKRKGKEKYQYEAVLPVQGAIPGKEKRYEDTRQFSWGSQVGMRYPVSGGFLWRRFCVDAPGELGFSVFLRARGGVGTVGWARDGGDARGSDVLPPLVRGRRRKQTWPAPRENVRRAAAIGEGCAQAKADGRSHRRRKRSAWAVSCMRGARVASWLIFSGSHGAELKLAMIPGRFFIRLHFN